MQSMIEAHGVGRRSSAWGSDDLSRRVWFGYWHAPLDFKNSGELPTCMTQQIGNDKDILKSSQVSIY
jgi:hypothetical protein